jgi:hypothetical protein
VFADVDDGDCNCLFIHTLGTDICHRQCHADGTTTWASSYGAGQPCGFEGTITLTADGTLTLVMTNNGVHVATYSGSGQCEQEAVLQLVSSGPSTTCLNWSPTARLVPLAECAGDGSGTSGETNGSSSSSSSSLPTSISGSSSPPGGGSGSDGSGSGS